MFRQAAALCITIVTLTGCSDRLRTTEQVQKAIVDRLAARSGLDLNQLDVTTTAVSFEKNKAFATVAFHPKNDPAVNNGMTMKYTLEEQGGKWVVVNVGDAPGHGTPGHGGMSGGSLPPGHPQVNSDGARVGAPEAK